MKFSKLIIRSETKPFERRAPLAPSEVDFLIKRNISVEVESSCDRIFKDEEYQSIGAKIVEPFSWVDSPRDSLIVGLKEIDGEFPLIHSHIYFGHCFKGQSDASLTINRFKKGCGALYDLEFVKDSNGFLVARPFSYWAGYCGAAISLLRYEYMPEIINQDPIYTLHSKEHVINEIANKFTDKEVKVIIIGSKGQSGKGAFDLLKDCNIDNVVLWDVEETKKGGPFVELNYFDILINCVYISSDINPFVNLESISKNDRLLSFISDVSCDPTSSNNPIRVYDKITTMDKPIIQVDGIEPPLFIQAIDHLPSLLPLESSKDISKLLIDPVYNLIKNETYQWSESMTLFEKVIRSS